MNYVRDFFLITPVYIAGWAVTVKALRWRKAVGALLVIVMLFATLIELDVTLHVLTQLNILHDPGY